MRPIPFSAPARCAAIALLTLVGPACGGGGVGSATGGRSGATGGAGALPGTGGSTNSATGGSTNPGTGGDATGSVGAGGNHPDLDAGATDGGMGAVVMSPVPNGK